MTSAVKAALLLSLCLFSSVAWGDCSRNEYGRFDEEACAAEAVAKADKELNAVYQQLLARLDDEARAKLKAAQRAWIAYKDANASFAYAMEGDGSAGRMVAWNQSEQATVARIKELRSWIPRE